jgi:hypothetical protein
VVHSRGIRFALRLLAEAQIAVGDEVDVTVEEGRVAVAPSP